MSFRALVLAGSRPGAPDPLAGHEGAAHKALIALDGRPLLERVCAALRDGGAQSIAVSCAEGPVAECARRLGAQVIAPAAGPSGSVLAALDTLGAPLLVTTADHGLLRGAWVRDLVAGAPERCDLAVMLARRDAVERAMPGSKRTYLRFADGQWSGCNLFYLRRQRARAAVELWQRIERDRKRPWRIVARLGAGTLLAYALGRLTLAQGIARLGRGVGIDAALVPAQDGLAAVDVDTPRDLADIRALLKRR